MSAPTRPETERAYLAVYEGIVAEVRALMPGLPQLACEMVALLHFEGPLPMDDLAATLTRSPSNVHTALRLLKAAGMITQQRRQGARRASYALRSAYPGVVFDAFIGELRRVRQENQKRLDHALVELGYENGRDTYRLTTELGRDLTSLLMAALHEAQPREARPSTSKAGSGAAPEGEP